LPASGKTPAPLTGTGIAARLRDRGFEPGADEAAALAAYLNLLEHWNRVHNLTGVRDRAELVDRHLVESLALEPFVVGARVADIGSGAGLPGIPLAIRLPEISFTLIESRRKRASFLRQVAATLGLANVSVSHGRAEQLSLRPFTTVLARAVASPAGLLSVVTPLVEPGGRLVLLTGGEPGSRVVALATGYRQIETGPPVPGLKSRIVVLERKLS
jgi:16S rRNA (guanine527-N7)-methyltransferase